VIFVGLFSQKLRKDERFALRLDPVHAVSRCVFDRDVFLDQHFKKQTGERKMDDAKTPAKAVGVMGEPYIFSMRNLPLLEQGTTYDSLATAPNLWLSIKVYASGGENALHAHRAEDHAFIVLQGEAIFTFGDGSQRKVGQYEGVMLPRNVHYKFEADAKQNLVLLRMGGGQRTIEGLGELNPFGTPKEIAKQTVFSDGSEKIGDAPRNGETSKKRIYAQGQFFAPHP
jgi:mannose-6-phosphate isomerase-like protein (cupin superfamily)